MTATVAPYSTTKSEEVVTLTQEKVNRKLIPVRGGKEETGPRKEGEKDNSCRGGGMAT